MGHVNEEQSLSRGIAPEEHPKGFNWGSFHWGRSGRSYWGVSAVKIKRRIA